MKKNGKKVALHNLGCKVNAYEMDVMQQKLQEKGYVIVSFDEMADIYIINTCTVTNIADRKSRQMLHRAKAGNPQAIVVAVGCYVQTGLEKIETDECIDIAVGNNQKGRIAEILEQFLQEREGQASPELFVADINAPGCDYEEMTLERTAEHTRAYIKIQDGCNQFCSYCAIPYARGRVRSRRWEEIRAEVEGLAAKGYQEFVLTGIHISSYGIDFFDKEWETGRSVVKKGERGMRDYTGSPKLLALLERIQEIPGIQRIRLGSLEPRIITPENAKKLASMDKLCPHFHLSLQSGCNETLKRMNRHYTTGEYSEGVRMLRTVYEHPAVTTDVIVGFPGETEAEFAETEAFLKEVNLYEMHIFKYSKRRGTAAERLPMQIPPSVQGKRSERLFALEAACSRAFREYYIGKEVEVLFESEKIVDGQCYQTGHTREYVKVAKKGTESLSNQIIHGRIAGFLKEDLLLMQE